MNESFTQSILVHICCSVDSHHFLSEMRALYPYATLIGYFYNPNIHPFEEYRLRLLDVQRSCTMLDISLIDDEYDVCTWLKETQGYEDAPEKGERCGICFDVRLHKTAQKAKELGVSYISTTLLTSPMKPQRELFALGENVANAYGLGFVALDTRSKGGTQKQQKLAKEAKLYRQNYCGCLFALNTQRERSQKKPHELMCPLTYKQYLQFPIHRRLAVYQQRIEYEKNHQPYLIYKKRERVYYPYHTFVRDDQKKALHAYPLAYSLFPYGGKRMQKCSVEWVEKGVGYCDRSEVFLLKLETFLAYLTQAHLGHHVRNHQNVLDLIRDPSNLEEDIYVRSCIEGHVMGTSLILVLDDFHRGDVLHIAHEAMCQEEVIEDLLLLEKRSQIDF